jgi:hypothetical protein
VKCEYGCVFVFFLIFGVIALVIMGIVLTIPKWVLVVTESEGDPNHIYSIFMHESGYRGNKVLSPVGCFLPFIILANNSTDIELFVLILLLSLV